MIQNQKSSKVYNSTKARTQWSNAFKILKMDYLQHRILYSTQLSIKCDAEKDIFRYASLQKIHLIPTLYHKDIGSFM